MSEWRVEQRGASWYVRWTGRPGGTIHDERSFLTMARAEAVADALNQTEAAEQRAVRRIRREVARYPGSPASPASASPERDD